MQINDYARNYGTLTDEIRIFDLGNPGSDIKNVREADVWCTLADFIKANEDSMSLQEVIDLCTELTWNQSYIMYGHAGAQTLISWAHKDATSEVPVFHKNVEQNS